ncbi:uncharacterized protein VTP21DRAFT_6716 [Calcarisporiella thermophila]|uniref:uncharacterized protein n=1 Tax=Calcarisporiella thermophila TaxID=911321 RepID=UPI003743ED26
MSQSKNHPSNTTYQTSHRFERAQPREHVGDTTRGDSTFAINESAAPTLLPESAEKIHIDHHGKDPNLSSEEKTSLRGKESIDTLGMSDTLNEGERHLEAVRGGRWNKGTH